MTYDYKDYHYEYKADTLQEKDGIVIVEFTVSDTESDGSEKDSDDKNTITYNIEKNTVDYYVYTYQQCEAPIISEEKAEIENTISKIEAQNLAISYVQQSGESKIKSKANCNSIKYLEVSSCEEGGSMSGVAYSFYVKGNFFGYDEYGTLIANYIYSWCIGIEDDGTVRPSYNLKISK